MLTYAEYLAHERESEVRHAFIDGEVLAMAGGSPTHALLSASLIGLLFAALRRRRCQVYTGDLRVRVDPSTAFYPDAAVACGPPEHHDDDADAVTDPLVVFEVLSPSTEAWDRGGKFERLQRLSSLKHYVLLHQERARVEVFTRNEDGESWTLHIAGSGQQVSLPLLGVTLAVDDLYGDEEE